MASYLPGVNDYIPQIQPFTPDYNFYAGSLGLKQGQADAARKQLSTLYGSLLNAPLTRDDNVEKRDQFFKTIEQDIHKMAGMDLSLEQNVNVAKGIFNQLIDDDNLVHDMVWSRQFQKESQRAQGFKNCIDPDECGGSWWEGGERLLKYQREEFRNAAPEDASRIGSPEFTPYQDVTKKAMAIAKEAGLSVTMDELKGDWITTTKNGALIAEPLRKLLQGQLASDPKITSYYKAQAKLQRKDFMYENAGVYGSLSNAEQAYIQTIAPNVERALGGAQVDLEESVTRNQQKIEKIEKAHQDAVPGDKTYLEELVSDYHGRQAGYESSLSHVTNANNEITNAKRNQRFSGDAIDNVIAAYQLGEDINASAGALAFKDASFKIKVNPYSLEKKKQRNRLALESIKFANKKELLRTKIEAEDLIKQLANTGGAEHNIPITVPVIPGATEEGVEDIEDITVRQRGAISFTKDRSPIRDDISRHARDIIQQVYHNTSDAADKGDAQAKEDYVQIFETYTKALSTTEDQVFVDGPYHPVTGEPLTDEFIFSGRRQRALKEELQNAQSLDEKYAIAKKNSSRIDFSKIAGSQIDEMYDNTIAHMIAPDKQGNRVLRDHLSSVWERTSGQRRSVLSNRLALEQMDKGYAELSQDVIKAVASQPGYGRKMSDAFGSYIDNAGHIVDRNTFIENMVTKGYKADEAYALYKGDTEDPTGPNWLRRQFNRMTWDGDEVESLQKQEELAGEGIHQMWQRAFSEHARPKGDFVMTGAGSEVARGANYPIVDPAVHQSNATMGTIGFLKDALADPATVYDMGGFKESVPSGSNEAKKVIAALLPDLINVKTGKSRPILNATYVNIAGGDGTKVGLNVKLNESYRKLYKGSKNNKGITADESLIDKGVTIYLDKNGTDNLFTTGAQLTPADRVMKWRNRVDIDMFPKYVKDFHISLDKNIGQYKIKGQIMSGLDENGLPKFSAYTGSAFSDVPIDQLVNDYEKFISEIVSKMQGIEDEYKANTHGK